MGHIDSVSQFWVQNGQFWGLGLNNRSRVEISLFLIKCIFIDFTVFS